jgi:hypothetical protein
LKTRPLNARWIDRRSRNILDGSYKITLTRPIWQCVCRSLPGKRLFTGWTRRKTLHDRSGKLNTSDQDGYQSRQICNVHDGKWDQPTVHLVLYQVRSSEWYCTQVPVRHSSYHARRGCAFCSFVGVVSESYQVLVAATTSSSVRIVPVARTCC